MPFKRKRNKTKQKDSKTATSKRPKKAPREKQAMAPKKGFSGEGMINLLVRNFRHPGIRRHSTPACLFLMAAAHGAD
jgi:glutamate/tyrosine decarboxylase-like PLP-dependent enzyme